MKNVRCLVTGSLGFMGSHLIEALIKEGASVTATDLETAYQEGTRPGKYPDVIKRLNVKFVPSDMRKPETLKDLIKDKEIIFHLASLFHYSASKELLHQVNVEGTNSLINLILDYNPKARLILWGAGGIYGFVPEDELPITEETPPSPPNNYLKSKWKQEWLVIEAGRKYGLKYTIIRPTTVYGPRAFYGGGQIILGLKSLPVLCCPYNLRTYIPFIHVYDVCNAAIHLAKTEKSIGEIYNLNDDSFITVYDYIKYMAGLLNKPFIPLPPLPITLLRPTLYSIATYIEYLCHSLNIKPFLEKDPIQYIGRNFIYSNSKLKATGYKFIYPNAYEGLKDTVKWYKEEGWL